MKTRTKQQSFDALDSAFCDFFVADMNGRRTDTHDLPVDEALYYADHDGARMGAIVSALAIRNGKRGVVAEAMAAWLNHINDETPESVVVDRE